VKGKENVNDERGVTGYKISSFFIQTPAPFNLMHELPAFQITDSERKIERKEKAFSSSSKLGNCFIRLAMVPHWSD
jgi:hypothetical protein